MSHQNRRYSYVHAGGPTPLIGDTIGPFLRDTARRHAESEAVVSVFQDVRLTYAELDERVDAVARGLISLGVARGDHVAIWSTNNVEWILLQAATARVGAVLVNINPAYGIAELAHALRLARISELFLIPSFSRSNYVERMLELAPELRTCDPDALRIDELQDLRHVVIYDPEAPLATTRPAPGFTTWSEFLAGAKSISADVIAAREAMLDPDDAVNIQFTSGTTGAPKAVVLTHHNILNNGFFTGAAMGLTPDDRLCIPVPFYHAFGLVVSNLACLTHGAAIVIPSPHFDAAAALTAVQQERCTALHGVPTMFVAELELPEFDRFDLSSLRTGIMAGAPCPPELVRRVMEDMGCREILIAYGMTESSPVTHITHPKDSIERRFQTVGRNMPHQEVKIVDPVTGATLPLGEPGEVCFRGYHVMRGYFADPNATADTVDAHGWLHSGDLGRLDADGYLAITGRLKDMIIRGGENIYPAEIESFMYEHPKIAAIAVFGVPSEKYGEEVAAWIQVHEGADAEAEEFREWARERIAYFKVPRYVWLVDEFPMTVSGKIQKFRIREIAARWLEQSESANRAPALA